LKHIILDFVIKNKLFIDFFASKRFQTGSKRYCSKPSRVGNVFFTGLTLLPFDSIETKIFEYIFSGAEPIGTYQIGGRLLHPFSGDAISTDIEILTFSQ